MTAAPPVVRRLAPATVPALVGGAMVGLAAVWPHLPSVGVLCPLRRLTGIPCPGCGMTTGVVDFVHGDPVGALAANPLSPLVVAAAVGAVVWWVWARLAGRPDAPVPLRRLAQVRLPLPLLAGGVAALWAFQLHRFGYL